MTPMARPDYRCGVPVEGDYKLILNSMDPKYGGTTEITKKTYKAVEGECDRRPYSIAYELPAYGCAVFEFSMVKPAKKAAAKKTAETAKKAVKEKAETAKKAVTEKVETVKKTAAKKTTRKAAAKKDE